TPGGGPRPGRRCASPASPCPTPWSGCCSPSSSTAPGRSTPGIPIIVSKPGAGPPAGGGRPETPAFIYLASRSPRRLALLEQIGVACRILVDDDEARAEALEQPLPGEAPAAYVRRVARAKAQAALERIAAGGLPPAPLLCADTTVALGGNLLGKPSDE